MTTAGVGPVTTSDAGRGGRAGSRGVLRWGAVALLGALLGVAGTVLHRAAPPWGLVLCLAVVLSATVVVRAWAGLLPVVGYAVGWLVVVQVLSMSGPGGDVLVPAGDGLGYVWAFGGMGAIGIGCFLPARWFSDVPVAPVAPSEHGRP